MYVDDLFFCYPQAHKPCVVEGWKMDALQKLHFPEANVRGETVVLHEELARALEHQKLPVAVRRLAGEVTAAALLTAAALEQNGSVVLQIAGDGPVGLVVAEVRADMSFRVNVQMKASAGEIDPNADLKNLVNRTGAGRCALILDLASRPRDQQPYQGVVPLEGASFSEVLENYFRASEQVETRIRIASDDVAAGGVMLQKMPTTGGVMPENFDPEGWERLGMFLSTVKSEELLTLSPEEIDRRLFWEESPRVTLEAEPKFVCSCSDERVENVIRSLGREEALEVVQERGAIEVTCQFCGRTRRYDKVDVEALFASAPIETTKA